MSEKMLTSSFAHLIAYFARPLYRIRVPAALAWKTGLDSYGIRARLRQCCLLLVGRLSLTPARWAWLVMLLRNA